MTCFSRPCLSLFNIRLFYLPLCLLIVCSAAPAAGAQDAELSVERYRELHAELQPTGNEPWRSIPWKISVLDAQQAAAEENKPIFLWAMDGHPLGCT